MGTGTYLGDPDARTDEAVTTAVIYSVAHGWNVIDTGVKVWHVTCVCEGGGGEDNGGHVLGGTRLEHHRHRCGSVGGHMEIVECVCVCVGGGTGE